MENGPTLEWFLDQSGGFVTSRAFVTQVSRKCLTNEKGGSSFRFDRGDGRRRGDANMAQGNNGAAALIYVEIADEPIIAGRPYTDKSTGMTRPAISKQAAYLHSGAHYPTPFKTIVPDAGPYRPGLYLLAGSVFKPGEYDGLKFFDRALQLVPIAAAVDLLKGLAGSPKIAAVG